MTFVECQSLSLHVCRNAFRYILTFGDIASTEYLASSEWGIISYNNDKRIASVLKE